MKFEDTISRLTPNDHVAFGVRNLIGIIPLAVIVSPFMLIMAPLQVALYEIGWEMTPKTPTRTGEALTGFAFGAMLWLGS